MKALTLTQPWASLVALGHKRIETRSWSTKYRGKLYIHAAKGFPRSAREFADEEQSLLPERLPRGMIVATARLVDIRGTASRYCEVLSTQERRFGDYYPGRYAWVLEDIVPLDKPIPWRGMLGLFNIELPVDVPA